MNARKRAALLKRHPEKFEGLRGRRWGIVEAGPRKKDGAPALLLCPGTLGRAGIFFQQIDALRREARVLAVTYPASDGIEDWVGDLRLMLERRGIDRVTILGSSLGGNLVQIFAAHYPELIDNAMPGNTLAAVSGINKRPPWSLNIDKTPIADIRGRMIAGQRAWLDNHPDHEGLISMLIEEINGGISARHLKALQKAPPLPGIDLPASCIAVVESADDLLITPDVRAGVRARFPRSTVYRFSHGGHFSYVVRPAEYIAMLRDRLGLNVEGSPWQGKRVKVA